METLEKETKGLEDWVRGVMVEDWAVCGVRGVSEEGGHRKMRRV